MHIPAHADTPVYLYIYMQVCVNAYVHIYTSVHKSVGAHAHLRVCM